MPQYTLMMYSSHSTWRKCIMILVKSPTVFCYHGSVKVWFCVVNILYYQVFYYIDYVNTFIIENMVTSESSFLGSSLFEDVSVAWPWQREYVFW